MNVATLCCISYYDSDMVTYMLDDDDNILAVIGFAVLAVVGGLLGFLAILWDGASKVLK